MKTQAQLNRKESGKIFDQPWLAYLSAHYIIHVYAPPKNFLKALWKNHVKHHYKDGDVAYIALMVKLSNL